MPKTLRQECVDFVRVCRLNYSMDDPSLIRGMGERGEAVSAGSAVWIIHRASRVSAPTGRTSRIHEPVLGLFYNSFDTGRFGLPIYNRIEYRDDRRHGVFVFRWAICRAIRLRLVTADFLTIDYATECWINRGRQVEFFMWKTRLLSLSILSIILISSIR